MLGSKDTTVSPALMIEVVKNHGIPEEDVNAAIEAGKKFFALPTEKKLEVSQIQILMLHNLP